jgi:surface polysaccharide O-acyltransferase-like enzyme
MAIKEYGVELAKGLLSAILCQGSVLVVIQSWYNKLINGIHLLQRLLQKNKENKKREEKKRNTTRTAHRVPI